MPYASSYDTKSANKRNNLELIRQKCIEANPEIVELKFGCEVQLYDEDFTVATYIGGVGKCTKHKKALSCNEDCDIESALWLAVVENDSKELYEPKEWIIEKSATNLYKIIGRPIRLADVLLVMAKRPYEDREAWHHDVLTLTTDGGRHWNLYADDLNEQSEETIDFLADCLAD